MAAIKVYAQSDSFQMVELEKFNSKFKENDCIYDERVTKIKIKNKYYRSQEIIKSRKGVIKTQLANEKYIESTYHKMDAKFDKIFSMICAENYVKAVGKNIDNIKKEWFDLNSRMTFVALGNYFDLEEVIDVLLDCINGFKDTFIKEGKKEYDFTCLFTNNVTVSFDEDANRVINKNLKELLTLANLTDVLRVYKSCDLYLNHYNSANRKLPSNDEVNNISKCFLYSDLFDTNYGITEDKLISYIYPFKKYKKIIKNEPEENEMVYSY